MVGHLFSILVINLELIDVNQLLTILTTSGSVYDDNDSVIQ